MAPMTFGLAVFLALATVAFHFLSPRNSITRYLVPRSLPRGIQPKTLIRQAGLAWIAFSTWLAALVISVISLLPKGLLEAYPRLLGLLMFVIPVTVVILQIVGWYYLIIGTFKRANEIRPDLRSYFEIEPDLLDRDIHRLGRCTTINLTSLFLVVALPATEALLNIEPEGTVVLLNVACLITWIFSMRKMHYYLTRSVHAMAKIEAKPFPITNLVSHHWIFIWRDSRRVRTFYESTWRPRHAKPTPHGQSFTRQGV